MPGLFSISPTTWPWFEAPLVSKTDALKLTKCFFKLGESCVYNWVQWLGLGICSSKSGNIVCDLVQWFVIRKCSSSQGSLCVLLTAVTWSQKMFFNSGKIVFIIERSHLVSKNVLQLRENCVCNWTQWLGVGRCSLSWGKNGTVDVGIQVEMLCVDCFQNRWMRAEVARLSCRPYWCALRPTRAEVSDDLELTEVKGENVCTHTKRSHSHVKLTDPVVCVRVRWIAETAN